MLDEKTIRWLISRKNYPGLEFCPHCAMMKNGGFPCKNWLIKGFCPTVGFQDFRDVAEFEARVAAKLAVESHNCGYCKILNICNGICEWERLKYARIEVEEEMDRP